MNPPISPDIEIFLHSISIPTKPNDLPPTGQIYPWTPPYGSNWGHKIAYFVFLPFITFILAFTILECIKRYWETICEESR